MQRNNTRYILSDDVAIEIIRSIKEVIFKLIEYKYQSAICQNKNI